MAPTLGRLVMDALALADQWKASGASVEDRRQGLEHLLRAHYPFTRVWRHLCEACEDTGLVIADCAGDASCGRQKPHLPHSYGRPCVCAKGAKFRDPAPAAPEDFVQAGKTAKGFSRVGRR